MKTPIKYMILLLVSGIIIPQHQHTGTKPMAPVISPASGSKQQTPKVGMPCRSSAFLIKSAAKLFPALKYF